MITTSPHYEYENIWHVFLDGKKVGEIHYHSKDDTYQYRAQGKKKYGGELFPTFDLCRASLGE